MVGRKAGVGRMGAWLQQAGRPDRATTATFSATLHTAHAFKLSQVSGKEVAPFTATPSSRQSFVFLPAGAAWRRDLCSSLQVQTGGGAARLRPGRD